MEFKNQLTQKKAEQREQTPDKTNRQQIARG